VTDGLSDFISLAPDDHVKLFFLVEAGGIERRDYTPRHFDQVARTLAIDFAVHDAGPPPAGLSRPNRATSSKSAARAVRLSSHRRSTGGSWSVTRRRCRRSAAASRSCLVAPE
jgi:hypothetical protein